MSIPFGCRVFFKSSPISARQPSKFEGDAAAGVFLGYVLDPGGKWSGEYYVVDLSAFAGKPLHRATPAAKLKVHVQRVRELNPVSPEDVYFPLRNAYEKANFTLAGIEAHMGIERGTSEYELPPDAPNDPSVLMPPPEAIDGVDPNNYQDDTNPVMAVDGDHSNDGSEPPQRTLTRARKPAGKANQPVSSGTVGAATDDVSGSGAMGTASCDAPSGQPQTSTSSSSSSSPGPSAPSAPPAPPTLAPSTPPSPVPDPNHPGIPWRPYRRDPVTKHWLDEYGNRIRPDSWRVPWVPIEDWNRKTSKTQVKMYERMRESVYRETGFDIATERKPPGWTPTALTHITPTTRGSGGSVAAATATELSDSPVCAFDPIAAIRPPSVDPTYVPAMPVVAPRHFTHRNKILDKGHWHWPAAVARPVPVKERLTNPKAKEACEEEWDKLLSAGTNGYFDINGVREFDDVRREYRLQGRKAHFGRIHELCYEKNSELPDNDPRKKYKGRDVFLGDQVKDQDGNVALFQDLSSAPATMAAGKFCDFHGLLPGNAQETSDVTAAYLQAFLGAKGVRTVDTWVEIPKHRWPSSWRTKRGNWKYRRPCCPLHMALYGHPEAGGYWERHCHEQVTAAGFRRAAEEWPGCYWHDELQCFLVVYVDDLKMSGPKDNLKVAWERLRKGLTMDDPEPTGRYLGCQHEAGEVTVDGNTYRTMTYNMEEFFDSCIEKYTSLAGPGFKLKKVPTPFVEDLVKHGPCAPSHDGDWMECGWCKARLRPEDFRTGKGRHYTQPSSCGGVATATGASAGCGGVAAATGGGTSSNNNNDSHPPRGVLADIASSILMKVLYGARMARFDLLRAVCALACCVTRWDSDCDRKLHRLMCYIHSTRHLRQVGFVGQEPHDVGPILFTDADFAGCSETMRSTSGVHVDVSGPATKFPVSGISKKQTAVSHSTPEAEIVAGAFGLRAEGIPALQLMDALTGNKHAHTLHFKEDNQAMIRVCETGRNPTMRHIGRLHGVSVAWLAERFVEDCFELE